MLDPALPHPPHLLTSFPPLPLFLISSTLLLVSTATSNKAFCFRSSMVKVDLFHDFNAEDLCFLSIFSSLGGDEMCQRGERVMVALLSVECWHYPDGPRQMCTVKWEDIALLKQWTQYAWHRHQFFSCFLSGRPLWHWNRKGDEKKQRKNESGGGTESEC